MLPRLMETKRDISPMPTVGATDFLEREQSVERTQRETRLFIELARLISSNLAPDGIVANLFELLRQVLPVDRLALAQMDGLGEETILMFPPQFAAVPLEREFVGNIARRVTRAHGLEQSGVASAELLAQGAGLDGAPQVRFVLAAPLLQQGSVNGALIIQFLGDNVPITESDRQIVVAVAQQLAVVLERERALDQARHRTDQLAAFSALASTVHEWVDSEQLARRFLAVFLNNTSTTLGLFYLMGADGDLRLVAQFGVPNDLVSAIRHTRLEAHPDAKRALEEGGLVTMDDLGHARISPKARELVRTLEMHAGVVLPLRVKGRGIGLVALARHDGNIAIVDREFLQGLADQAAQAIENARLFAESERRFKEQSALRELAQRFLSAVTPDQIIEWTLDALANLVPGDYYEILLPDAEGAFAHVSGRGWRRGVVGRVRTVADPHIHAGYVLRAQSPVIVDDFSSERRFQPAGYLTRHRIVAGVCAPMLAETRAIGMLGIYSCAARQFTEEQAHFLYLVATQTAMALEKARHSQAAARRLDELILLNDVVVAANSEVSLERVVSSVGREIGELLQSDDVHVTFAPENAQGNQNSALALPQPTDSDWGDAVARWVMRNRKSLLVPDLVRDARFSALDQRARACLGAPMMIKENVIGVIAVAHPEANSFDENDLRLLTTLAGQIAAAIERARLLDETRIRLAEISAMFEFSNALRTPTTRTELLEVVMQDAVSMLQANGGSIQLLMGAGDYLQVVAVSNMRNLGFVVPREMGGLSWEVYATGETIAIHDVMQDSRVHIAEVFEHMHGAIVAPMRTPSGVLGTLFVGFDQVGAPGPNKQRFATMVANLAAQALQRLRLHEQTVEQAAFVSKTLNELEASYQATLLALSAALDARDRETKGHSQRVTKWALAIGQQLQLTANELTNLERGALLHDVGKIGISDNILRKAGPLTPAEREIMNRHPQLGYEMLRGIAFLQAALPVVLHHQERYDGSGYPAGLAGEEIPLAARIFAVADTYDAMTSTRPYRQPLSHAEALAEIDRCRGTQFDPSVVDAFLSLFAEENIEKLSALEPELVAKTYPHS